MLTTSMIAIALTATTPVNADQMSANAASEDGQLSVAALSAGRNELAIAELESSGALTTTDPAQLINLGIAYARQGDNEQARTLFKAALTSPEPIELETADGSLTDSRRLARKALRMLDAGAFAPVESTSRVTMRQ